MIKGAFDLVNGVAVAKRRKKRISNFFFPSDVSDDGEEEVTWSTN